MSGYIRSHTVPLFVTGISSFLIGFIMTEIQYAILPLDTTAEAVTAILVPLYTVILIAAVPLNIVQIHKGSRGVIARRAGSARITDKGTALILLFISILVGVVIWQFVYTIVPGIIVNLGRFMLPAMYGSFPICFPMLSFAYYGNMKLPRSIWVIMTGLFIVFWGSLIAAVLPI